MIRRRTFIAGLGGAVAWPVVARGQQKATPVIGFLAPVLNDDQVREFKQGLKQAGFVDGENLSILYRSAENEIDRLPALADDLARRQVAVIAAVTQSAAFAAKAATTTIPVVFIAGEDPAKLGLVVSLARPGGNLTGTNVFTAELVTKRLQLLRELVPSLTRVAVLVDPTAKTITDTTLKEAELAAHAMGLQVRVLNASNGREIGAAFAAFERERPDALFVSIGPLFTSRRVQIANLAARQIIPMTSGNRQITEAGGLMSYGASITEAHRQIGAYAGRILKGEKPADLPVVQASKFELVINAETARILGLTVPPPLLAIADEVIEMIRRREFNAGLGGTMASWPLTALAQQQTKPTVIWFGVQPGPPETFEAFRRGLAQVGFSEGRDVTVEYHTADGHLERLPELASDLVRRRPTAIFVPSSVSASP
jgi:putative ABC transport system substrate-binding protein